MKVIVISNQKGGTGKTTIAINMCAYLTNQAHNVLLIDADAGQESASDWADLNSGKYFDIISLKASQIKDYLRRNEERYQYVVIDCPPRANKDAGLFIQVADLILIPVQPSPFDVWATTELCDIIQARRDATAMNDDLKGGRPLAAFVLSNATRGSRLVGETLGAIEDTGFLIYKPMTTQYQVYKRSIGEGRTIFDASERQENAEVQIKQITEQTLEILKC